MKRTIILEGERPTSLNQFYSQSLHWSKRKKIADAAHLLVRAHIDPDWEMYDVPVAITVTAYFDKHPQDADNIVSKVFIDGLIGWLIVDDKPEYVRSVTTVSLVDKERPRIEIHIQEFIDVLPD